jgi:hypothetical protein
MILIKTTMTLTEFITRFDIEHSFVLLEGKRNVLTADKAKLTALGALLASKTEKMTFRSGNADGSDQLFSDGVTSVNPKRLQVITPYTGHRKKTNHAYETIDLDTIKCCRRRGSTSTIKKQQKNGKAHRPVCCRG